MIWVVTVVPILAPMMIPTDWAMVMRLAVTNPTTSTVVTVEELTMAVTRAPVRTAVNRLVVRRERMSLRRPPATAFRASDRSSSP